MVDFKPKPITANLTVVAPSDGTIRLQIRDAASGVTFVELALDNEQFVNAVVRNRADTKTLSALVRGLDIVGKTMEMKQFKVMLPPGSDNSNRDDIARACIKSKCPEGWYPDLGLGCQDSYTYEGEHGERIVAHTIIRRWV